MGIGISGQSIQISAFLNPGPMLDGVKAAMGGLTKLAGRVTKVGAAFMAFGAIVGFVAIRQLMKAGREAIKFQTEMAELIKILGTKQSYAIAEQIGDLSEIMPIARKELMGVAETAARLGVRGTKNIVEFTRVMGMMGVATNITAKGAADALARIALQTRMPINQMENLGSVINELANTTATSSREIVEAMRRSAPELARFGLNVEEIAALSATLNTVSESASRAGTRLRRLAQTLTDPGKVMIFARAIGRTADEFREFANEDAKGAIIAIVRAFEKGGNVADNMARNLDARVRLALAALAAVGDDLEENFEKARIQMEAASSLGEEYNRFLGLIVSKQQILNNKIAENRREIGERMLPVYEKWYNLLLNIADIMNDIFDTPLEHMISPELMEDMKTATEDYMRSLQRMDKKAFKEMFGKDFLGIDWLRIQQAPQDAAKGLRFVQQRMLRDAGIFSEDMGRIMKHTLEKKMDPEEMIIFWGRLTGVVDEFNTLIDSDPAVIDDLSTDLSTLTDTLLNSTFTIDQIYATWDAFFGVNMAKYAGHIGTLADLTDQFTDDQEELLQAVDAARLKLVPGDEVDTLLRSDLYKAGVAARDRLKESTEGLAAEEMRRLLIGKLFADVADQTVYLYREEDRRVRNLTLTIERHSKSIKARADARREEAEMMKEVAGDANAFMKSLTDEMRADDTMEGEIARKHAEAIALITSLPPELMELKDAILETFEAWATWRVDEGGLSELEKAMERLKNRMDFTTMQGRMRLLERIIDGMTDSALEFFEAIVTGSGNAVKAITDMIKGIAYQIARAALFRQILNWIGPDGADWLGINELAKGGPLRANQLAIVGEKGPELFVPNVGGRIIPNNKLGGGQQEVVVINNHFTIKALDGANVREVLAKEQKFITGLSIDTIQRHRALKR